MNKLPPQLQLLMSVYESLVKGEKVVLTQYPDSDSSFTVNGIDVDDDDAYRDVIDALRELRLLKTYDLSTFSEQITLRPEYHPDISDRTKSLIYAVRDEFKLKRHKLSGQHHREDYDLEAAERRAIEEILELGETS